MFRAFSRNIHTITSGGKYTLEFKKYLADAKGRPQSFFHDVPLNYDRAEGTVNMVVEIPRYEQGKFEISKELPLNPIVQDTKKGKPRFINNIYPFHGYPCNYGAVPQTWEDPTLAIDVDGKQYYGDNDPLDICEIGSNVDQAATVGTLKRVKILGCLAMIDDGEMDWKLLAIDTADKLAPHLHEVPDVEEKMPLLLENLTRWFKNYKLPMNKPENEFAFQGRWLGRARALDVIDECHHRWQALVAGSHTGKKFPLIANETLPETPGFQTVQQLETVKTVFENNGSDHVPLEAREIFYYRQ